MENKEIICEYTATLEINKKACRFMYIVEGLVVVYIFMIFLTLVVNLVSKNLISIVYANVVLIICTLSAYIMPFVSFKKKSNGNSLNRILLIGENEIKTNSNISIPTNHVKKIYENRDFYYLVAKKRIRILIPKSGLNVSEDEFEEFMFIYFKGLRKNKIFQLKKVLIRKIILSLIACLLYFGILIELGSYWIIRQKPISNFKTEQVVFEEQQNQIKIKIVNDYRTTYRLTPHYEWTSIVDTLEYVPEKGGNSGTFLYVKDSDVLSIKLDNEILSFTYDKGYAFGDKSYSLSKIMEDRNPEDFILKRLTKQTVFKISELLDNQFTIIGEIYDTKTNDTYILGIHLNEVVFWGD